MKKNSFIFLFIITLAGLLLRLYGIDKDNGLWYDEMLSYSLSKESFPLGIIETVSKNEFQGFLHYLYLGFWMILFGESDLSLRMSSLIFGVLLIPSVYFLARELYSKNAGLFAAFIAGINPVLIYYSQEVRPYSLLSFLSVLSFFFLIRAGKKNDFLNYLLWIVFSVLILYTYTIGFVFVFLQAVFFYIYLIFSEKQPLKKFISSILAVITFYSPYVLSIVNNFSYYIGSSFINPFFYSKLSWYSILITLQDWFTPMICGVYHHDPVFYANLFFNRSGGFFIFGILMFTVFIFLYGLFKTLKTRDNKIFLVFLTCAGFLFVEVIAALSGNFCLVTRHTLLIFTPLLVLCCGGLWQIKNRKVFIFLLSIVFVFYINNYSSQAAVQKWERGGIKSVVRYLEKYNLGAGDIITVPSHSIFVKKYFPGVKTLNINYMKAFLLDKSKQSLKKIISDKKIINKTNKNNGHSVLKPYLKRKEPDSALKNKVIEKISTLKKGNYFILCRKVDYSSYDEKELEAILKNPEKYENTALLRMMASKIINDIQEIAARRLQLTEAEQVNPVWKVYVFTKI